MRKRLTGLTFLLVLLWAQGDKGISKVGTTAASFLEIGVGSRSIGMGGAFVAVADDATALYWNPAGLSRSRSNEALFIHTEWLADINFDYLGFMIYLGRIGSIGGSLTAVTMGDMEVRTVQQPEGTGELFSASDIAASLTYAYNLTDRFSIGGNVKFIQQQIWHMKATGFAIDVGTLFKSQFKDMKIGAVMYNFGSDMRLSGKNTLIFPYDIDPVKAGNNESVWASLDTDTWPLPLNFQAGIALDVINRGRNKITVALDVLHPSDNTEAVNIGGEYVFNNLFNLRAGWRSLFQRDSEEGLTVGAGVVWPLRGFGKIVLDYSYADFGILQNTQQFSFSIKF